MWQRGGAVRGKREEGKREKGKRCGPISIVGSEIDIAPNKIDSGLRN